MKQNWLLLIFFFTLPSFSTAKSKTIQCESFTIQHDVRTNGIWDLGAAFDRMQERKDKIDCEKECAMYICFNIFTGKYLYGSSCYDINIGNVCKIDKGTTHFTKYGDGCLADVHVLVNICTESCCLNTFNKCVEEWKQKNDKLADLAWNKIQLYYKPNSNPEISITGMPSKTTISEEQNSTISNSSLETTTTVTLTTTTTTTTTTKASIIISSSPNPITKSNEDVWKTECIEGKCEAAMKIAEEDGNFSFALKNHYSIISFLGIVFIKFVIFAFV